MLTACMNEMHDMDHRIRRCSSLLRILVMNGRVTQWQSVRFASSCLRKARRSIRRSSSISFFVFLCGLFTPYRHEYTAQRLPDSKQMLFQTLAPDHLLLVAIVSGSHDPSNTHHPDPSSIMHAYITNTSPGRPPHLLWSAEQYSVYCRNNKDDHQPGYDKSFHRCYLLLFHILHRPIGIHCTVASCTVLCISVPYVQIHVQGPVRNSVCMCFLWVWREMYTYAPRVERLGHLESLLQRYSSWSRLDRRVGIQSSTTAQECTHSEVFPQSKVKIGTQRELNKGTVVLGLLK